MTSLDLGKSRGRPRAGGFTELGGRGRSNPVVRREQRSLEGHSLVSGGVGGGAGPLRKAAHRASRALRQMPPKASGTLCACRGVGRNGLRPRCTRFNSVSRLGKERGRRAVDR